MISSRTSSVFSSMSAMCLVICVYTLENVGLDGTFSPVNPQATLNAGMCTSIQCRSTIVLATPMKWCA